MTKKESKIPSILAVCLLIIIILSSVSSAILFKETSKLQVSQDRAEIVFFMRQYEYELLRTQVAFVSLYENIGNDDNQANFDKWFDVLWSRVDSMNHGLFLRNKWSINLDIGFLQKSVFKIDELINSNDSSLVSFEQAKQLFNELVDKSHNDQLTRDYKDRSIELIRQNKTDIAYRNSLILSIATFLIALLIIFYLIRNNQKLKYLKVTLEDRVAKRTNDLKENIVLLEEEVRKHTKAESELQKSKAAAEEAKAKVVFQANYDPLTSLANRHLFTEKFNDAIDSAEKTGKQVALLFLDLDRFKYINDTFGHSAGDNLLCQTSVRLKEIVTKDDTVARFGGDEFAVILSNLDTTKFVDAISLRILNSLSLPYYLSNNEAFLTTSIGISIYPRDGEQSDVLIRKADNAMYKAKKNGKNKFYYFTHAMDVEANKRRQLESSLYKALDEEQFFLMFQPIINSDNQMMVGAESLLKWKHPEFGIIPTGDFISLAEEIGVIVPIGSWIIKSVCEFAVKCNNNREKALYFSVNVSSRQFQQGKICELINESLLASGLEPKCLVLELTESLLLSDEPYILEQLNNIRNLGVSLAIDDFGTGYSSLSYLRKFPINILKIDQSFITGIGKGNNDDELIQGILSMAKSLNLRVIAEGVEQEEQLNFLNQNECKFIQGYYYSKPLDSKEFSAYMDINSESVHNN